MSLQEFDALIDRMKLAFEYAENLGQYVDAAKIESFGPNALQHTL